MTESWLVPCNIKTFDIIEHFKNLNTVIWKNSFSIKEDDIAYIYVGKPYSEIKFKCRVISTNISNDELQKNSYAITQRRKDKYYSGFLPQKEKYMKLELIYKFVPGALTLEELRKHGLMQFQMQARIDKFVQKYILSIEKEYTVREDNN